MNRTVFQKPGFKSRPKYMFFTSIKVASSWRTPLQVAESQPSLAFAKYCQVLLSLLDNRRVKLTAHRPVPRLPVILLPLFVIYLCIIYLFMPLYNIFSYYLFTFCSFHFRPCCTSVLKIYLTHSSITASCPTSFIYLLIMFIICFSLHLPCPCWTSGE